MPLTLPEVDLTSAIVGQAGNMPLAPDAGQGGVSYATFGQFTLRLHNESAAGLQCSLAMSGQQFYLPAGAWLDCYPTGGDNALNFTVKYVLTNPGVSLLLGTLYAPGEPVPAMPILGNSPIGGGSIVSTTSNQLISTGFPAGTSIIEANSNTVPGPTATATNDGLWRLSSTIVNALVTWLQSFEPIPGGTILQLGATNYLTEILGGLQVDGDLKLSRGSISKIAIDGPFSVTPTATFFNHSLGVVPDFCFVWLAFASNASCSCTLDKGSMTATQYEMQSNIALAPIFVLSIKQ